MRAAGREHTGGGDDPLDDIEGLAPATSTVNWADLLRTLRERLLHHEPDADPGLGARRRVAIAVFAGIVLAGVGIGFAQSALLGGVFHRSWPLNTFLHHPSQRFTDYSAVVDPVRNGDPYATGTSNYLPFGYAIALPLTLLPNPVGVALLIFAATALLGGLLLWAAPNQGLRSGLVAAAGLLSYPVLFAIDRGNFTLLMVLLIGAGVLAIRARRFGWAAVLLSFAAAMKGYPAIFLVLLARPGRRRFGLLSVVLILAETAMSLVLLPGTLAQHVSGFRAGLSFYQNGYIIGNNGVAFCSSIYCAMKYSVIAVAGPARAVLFGVRVQTAYTVASAVLTLLCAAAAYRVEALWRQVAILSVALLLFPAISADYNLVLLLVPLCLLLRDSRLSAREYAFSAAVALLFVPKNLFHLPVTIGAGWGANIGQLINPVLLLVGLGLVFPLAVSPDEVVRSAASGPPDARPVRGVAITIGNEVGG